MASDKDDGWEEVPVEAADDGWEEVPVELPRPKTDELESLARGATQGLTFGLADEAVGGLEAAFDVATTDKSVSDFLDLYKTRRDESRSNFKKAEQDNPGTYMAGDIAGSVASSFIPGLGWTNATKAATTAGRLGLAGLSGAVNAAGRSEADLTEGDVGQFAGDVGVGAAMGAGFQAVGDKVGKLISSKAQLADDAGDALKGAAERRAFKAAVGNQGKVYESAQRTGTVNRIGRDLLDEDVVTFGTSARNIAERAKGKQDEAWEGIEGLFSQIDETAPDGVVSGKQIADDIVDFATKIDSPNDRAAVEKLLEQAAEFEDMGSLTLAEAQRLKNRYKWDPRDPNKIPVGKDAANHIYLALKNAQESGVERVIKPAGGGAAADQFADVLKTGSGTSFARPGSAVLREAEAVAPELAPAQRLELYKNLKKKFGSMATAEDAAETLANRQEKNRTLSLTDMMAAGAQYVANPGDALKALAVGVGSKTLRERGSSMAAVGMDKLGDVVKASPEAFGKYAPALQEAARRGGHSLGVTHFLLLQQDPGYRKQLGLDDE